MLDELARLRRTSPALPALAPAAYARAHALFESRSDQRRLLTGWLTAAARDGLLPTEEPVDVVSVGCGDGTVDAPFAAALSRGGRAVRYLGVEPHPPSAAAFVAAVQAGAPGVTVRSETAGFDDWSPGSPPDLVMFVHSLYYVEDVAAAIRRCVAMLAAGGRLLVLQAPRERLCALTDVLTPPAAGHGQWWSSDVRRALAGCGLDVREERIAASLDLTECFEGSAAGALLLDFVAQADTAGLSAGERALALAHLRADAVLTAGRVLVAHPLDAFVATRPA